MAVNVSMYKIAGTNTVGYTAMYQNKTKRESLTLYCDLKIYRGN
jgi:hypothetical protein